MPCQSRYERATSVHAAVDIARQLITACNRLILCTFQAAAFQAQHETWKKFPFFCRANQCKWQNPKWSLITNLPRCFLFFHRFSHSTFTFRALPSLTISHALEQALHLLHACMCTCRFVAIWIGVATSSRSFFLSWVFTNSRQAYARSPVAK